MKKILLTSLLAFCLGIFLFAQTTAVFASVSDPVAKALSDGRNGAVIQWKIERETNNLGFNVYRIEGKRAIAVNNQIVAGSSLVTAERMKSEGEFIYSVFDSNGTASSLYVIEAIDLDGKTERFEVRAEFAADITPLMENQSPTLEDIAKSPVEDVLSEEFPTAPDDKFYAALNEQPLQNPVTQKWVAAQPGAKIAVKAEGLYRVTRAQLAATNFDVNSPVANWQLYTDGVEQAIIVGPNGDYIEFYGRKVDNLYSDTKFYYLVAGTGPGRRMIANDRRLNATRVTASSFSNNLLIKPRVYPDVVYSGVILNGEEENFFGRAITSVSTLNVPVNIRGIDTTKPTAMLSIRIQGLTTVLHSVQVTLNGTDIGTITGLERTPMVKLFSVPTSLLIEGTNTFGFRAAAGGDVSLFDSINVSYSRLYQAESNRLTFSTAYNRATSIFGFTSSNIRVFDITDPNGTATVNARMENIGAFFGAIIGASRPRMLYAITNDALLSPSAVTSNSPSTILNSVAGKDLVIISHANFLTLSETLAVYRRSQGLTVEVVNVEDVFDESGYGQVSPYSIGSFLQSVNVKYAMLVGDATLDPRGYYTTVPFSNYVPTKIVDTLFGEISTDDAMGDFNNDAIPEIPIGRLPVKDNTELQNIINKIQSFEATVGTTLTQKGALFVSDSTDGWDFYESNRRVRAELPATVPEKHIKRSDGTPAEVRTMITNDINAGRFIVAYSGHGSVSAWGNSPNFYSTADVPNLTNTVYPLFLPSNCLNGAFAEIFSESLGELILESKNGAVASWASSGLTFPDSQEQMALRFFRAIGTAEFARIGDAIKVSKGATLDRDVRNSWVLLGDPTLKIR